MNSPRDNHDEGARLHPDTTIRFEKKKLLYRKPSRLPLLPGFSGAAAVLLFFLGLRLFFGNRETTPESQALFSSGTERIQALQPARPLEAALLAVHTERPQEPLSLRQAPTLPVTESPLPVSTSRYGALEQSPAMERNLAAAVASRRHTPGYKQELVLNESAEEWKPSGEDVYSRNIFSSVASAGRHLAEQIREFQ